MTSILLSIALTLSAIEGGQIYNTKPSLEAQVIEQNLEIELDVGPIYVNGTVSDVLGKGLSIESGLDFDWLKIGYRHVFSYPIAFDRDWNAAPPAWETASDIFFLKVYGEHEVNRLVSVDYFLTFSALLGEDTMYEPLPDLYGDVVFKQEIGVSASVGPFFAGGAIEIYDWISTEKVSFFPYRGGFSVSAGLDFDWIVVGYEHYCTHPITPFNVSTPSVWDAFHDRVYVQFNVKIGG